MCLDANYQLRVYHHVRLKSRKFYKYIFWFIFDLCITNSTILYTHFSGERRRSMKEYRVELAKGLIDNYNSRKRPGRPSVTAPSKRFCFQHFPTHGSQKTHRCHYCHNYKQRRRETTWYCKECEKYLCHNGQDDCFYIYHMHSLSLIHISEPTRPY